jgi:hypothetical protein
MLRSGAVQECLTFFVREVRRMPLEKEIERFRKDGEYLEEHRKELLEQYPEQWVAIFNGEVVAAAEDHEELLDQLEANRIPVGQARREYLTRSEDILILPG